MVSNAVWSVPLCCLLLSGAAPALAAGWSASSCGHEPAPPAVTGGSVDRYNASIDRVASYDKAARAYSDCVSRQSVAEQSAISSDARARMAAINQGAVSVQKRIGGNFAALSAQLRAAGQKLGVKQ